MDQSTMTRASPIVTCHARFRMRPTVVVMLKEPRAGQVKTRLGRDIGMTAAVWWFRHQSARLLRRLRDPRWNLILAIAPDRAKATRAWPAHLPRIGQGSGDLGHRMASALATFPGPTLVIGGDIPGITRRHIARAFRDLGGNDAVFGPATDGGYWLVGLARTRPMPAGLFRQVRWSTEHALADTIASLQSRRIALTTTLSDVDTADDLSDRSAWR